MKKKLLCLLLSALLVLSILPQFAVLAEPEAPFTLTVNTQDGSEPVIASYKDYTLTMKFAVAARGSAFDSAITFEKITWSNKEILLDQTVSAEDSELTIENREIQFLKEDGGHTVTFKLYWHYTDDENPQEPVSVDFKLAEQDVSMDVRAIIEQTNVVPGSEIMILYEAQNIGNVPVQYVTIYDDDVTSILQIPNIAFMERMDDKLMPGETFSQTVMIKLDSSLTVHPHITYFYVDKSYEENGEETQITVNEVLPTVSLTCETYSVAQKGDTMHFTYTIRNTSTAALKDVRVFDADSPGANLVNVPFDLEPDAVYEGSFDAVINRSGFYKFKINYTYDSADGDLEVSAKTERSIRIPSEVTFRITDISPKSISEAGDMLFSLTVENAGSTELTDLSITEENGLMDPLALNVIIPGSINGKNGELTRTVTVRIPATGTKLKFNLGYRIDGEYATTNTSYTVDFDQPLQTQTPAPTAAPTSTPTVENKDSSLLIWILLCVLLLVLIAGLIVLLIVLRRRSAPEDNHPVRRRIDSDFDESDDAGYLYTDPSEQAEETDEAPEDDPEDTDDEGVKIYRKHE